MLGLHLVILWLVFFGIISNLLCRYLKLNTSLLCTIFVWTFLMVFIYIFEMMLLFYNDYLEIKGKESKGRGRGKNVGDY
jgi:hypothetical protein